MGIALLVSLLMIGLYYAVTRPTRTATKPLDEKPARTKLPSSSDETLVDARGRIPPIAEPAPAYTATADNAAPGAEDALFRAGRANSVKNQRRAVQVFEKPLVLRVDSGSVMRPPWAGW
ncbi:hypothetical protein DFH09DRAFT_1202565 [Mycena vulgaris]|nr:hypothetical protein DFH09DRAFT_1202565 [Mycena vulgaris]